MVGGTAPLVVCLLLDIFRVSDVRMGSKSVSKGTWAAGCFCTGNPDACKDLVAWMWVNNILWRRIWRQIRDEMLGPHVAKESIDLRGTGERLRRSKSLVIKNQYADVYFIKTNAAS